MPHPGAVEAEPLAQLDDLQRRLVAGPRIIPIEQANGQEPEPLQRDLREDLQ